MKVLIIGAGGHGQVVADMLLARAGGPDNTFQPMGFLDDAVDVAGKVILGLPVLGTIADLAAIPHQAVIIGIGHNPTRTRLFNRFLSAGEKIITVVHPAAVIGANVTIGAGTVICAGVVVNTGSVIGQNVILNTGCTVDHHNHLGDHTHIAPGVHLGGEVKIGVGCLIGIGATVMPQRTIGAGCTIGAGAVVTQNIPTGVTAIGVPARVIK